MRTPGAGSSPGRSATRSSSPPGGTTLRCARTRWSTRSWPGPPPPRGWPPDPSVSAWPPRPGAADRLRSPPTTGTRRAGPTSTGGTAVPARRWRWGSSRMRKPPSPAGYLANGSTSRSSRSGGWCAASPARTFPPSTTPLPADPPTIAPEAYCDGGRPWPSTWCSPAPTAPRSPATARTATNATHRADGADAPSTARPANSSARTPAEKRASGTGPRRLRSRPRQRNRSTGSPCERPGCATTPPTAPGVGCSTAVNGSGARSAAPGPGSERRPASPAWPPSGAALSGRVLSQRAVRRCRLHLPREEGLTNGRSCHPTGRPGSQRR